MTIYLNELGLACALGSDKQTVLNNFLAGDASFMKRDNTFGIETVIGQVDDNLPDLSTYGPYQKSRNNQLALLAFQQIEGKLSKLKSSLANKLQRDINIAVIIGTSTSGIASGEASMQNYLATGEHNANFNYTMQEMGATAEFIALLAQANASVYGISTACTSSAKALISGQRLLASGLADIVIAGGVDSLCKMTINGFNALESISANHTQPMQETRCGINIGEAAALFIMSQEQSEITLSGFGESSDAHHISAPQPEGIGARKAMLSALESANLTAKEINYINLHATGTLQNDAMEAKAVASIFSNITPCSASKQLHGHCLGAAGALEAGLCWLLLSTENNDNNYPVMHLLADVDDNIDEINLISESCNIDKKLNHCMSNSYAFGGNNASLVLSRTHKRS
ncbi:beta-ketoacyl-ACP synthase [Colwellia sp. RSH04]|uniref:beta-ketoacyl-ACP synthase n=1 Tax=Colwellia sp. RSH04 TaxID=2305464 RepID=UPI000E5862A6|nr:beta-ketoacyl-ACP synthase [Colwellia sp. RSH04]RHW75799.1 beta-ketoacyl-ACP synthase [Colwellia sp. RSH04]